MLAVDPPGERSGNFSPNFIAASAIPSPVTGSQLPEPWTPLVWRQSGAYSSMAKPTRGLDLTFWAVRDDGLSQMNMSTPSLT